MLDQQNKDYGFGGLQGCFLLLVIKAHMDSTQIAVAKNP
jgi:hypothetical protein